MKKFQEFCYGWARRCLGEAVANDKQATGFLFTKVALELAQSLGLSKEAAHGLVDYAGDKAVSEPHQKMGEAMLALALLARVHGLDMELDGYKELARVLSPEGFDKAQIEQRAKR